MHNPPGKYSQLAQPKVGGAAQFTAPWGFGQNVVSFALPWSRYMAKYGATREQLGTFVVRNRANAAENPNAVFYRRPITLDDYLGDRIVAEPLSLLDCDMPVDGCGALVLTTVERARDLKQSPAVIRGGASLGIPPRRSLVLTLENFIESGGQLARALWSGTDLTASDVTHAQLYDGFSYFTPIWLELFGFFPEGEGLLAIQDDTTTRTGKLPINTGGGALGMGRLHGSPQLIEAVLQIQGRAGPRQVADPSVALVHAGSPWHHCAALLLTA
jgi:acetyl-CoA acetyltransferase